ncbi:MAG TPA: efflux RND transporter periplasmic adaptor subunit [Blastocatellia bacterium]|nr:efflux RND transporter periplasmic adaptor subunit [Blastocatellia bacterium]
MSKIKSTIPISSCIAAVALAVIAAFTSTACSRVGNANSAGAKGDSAETQPGINVGVVKVERRPMSQAQTLMAEFTPYQEVDLHAKVAGYLKTIYVDVGDRVKKGQLLAILEIPEQQADLEEAAAAVSSAQEEIGRAESELHEAQAANDVAHITYTRLAEVPKVSPHLIAQQEIDEAMAKDRESEAKVATSKAAISVARQRLAEAKAKQDRIKTLVSYTRIEAPFGGVITKRYADTGAMIPAGTSESTQALPVVRISEDDTLRLILPVPESIVGAIRVGGPVEVHVQSMNHTFQGTVWRFTGKVDTSTRTMDTEVYVKNADHVLKPGLYATARLTLDQAQTALAVPVQAVSVVGEKATVWAVKGDNTLEEREIKTGAETPTMIEVLSGLSDGDMVVIGSRSELKAGQRVEPKIVQVGESG